MKTDKMIVGFAIIVLLVISVLLFIIQKLNKEDENQPDMLQLITGQYKHPNINPLYKYKYEHQQSETNISLSSKGKDWLITVFKFSIIASVGIVFIINHGSDPCSIKKISLCKTKKYSIKAHIRGDL